MAVSLKQFRENLAKSSLFSAEELTAFQESLPPEKRPKDTQGLARELILANKLTKYQATMVYKGRTKGLVLGEYTILDQIGAGGMGQVLKARHRRMDRVVALKMLPPKAMRSAEAVKRFYQEVRAAAKLNHPNVVTAYDASEHEGIHYLVMAYVEGKDLSEIVVERGRFPAEQAVDCIIQAAKGLEYAHSEGVVHRDIKPANLLLDRKGTIKILDMGLARLGEPGGAADDESESLTATGQVMGTYDYMAPEQAEDTHHADGRADIYSLGCTLYRLLIGHRPFRGDTIIKVLLAHQQAPIPSLCDARPDLPKELDEVFQRMLAKRPADRYQSMTEVVAALETCVAPQPVAAEPSSDGALTSFFEHLAEDAAVPTKKPAREPEETIQSRADEETGGVIWKRLVTQGKPGVKLYAAVGASVAALLVVLAVLMSLLGGGDEGEPAEGKGVATQSKTSPDGQSGKPVSGTSGSLPAGAQGKREDRTPPAVIRRGDLPTVGSVTLTPRTALTDFAGPVTSFAFGPDGQMLATNANGRGMLAVWDAAEGEEIVSKRAHDEGIWGIDFADNGKKVAAGTYKRATIWTPNTGDMNHFFRGQPSTIISVAFAPGSGQLAMACSEKTIWMWDVATAQPVWKIADAASYDDLEFSLDGLLLASCGYDAAVRLWEAATGDPVAVLEGHEGRVRAVSFTRDGRQIASASEDGAVRIWDVAGRKELLELDHPDKVHAVSFSRFGNVVASGCEDGKVRLWDAATGELLKELDDHTGPVRCVKFAPKGNLLASGGDDRTVHVWDVKITVAVSEGASSRMKVEQAADAGPDGVMDASGIEAPPGQAQSQAAVGQVDAAGTAKIDKQKEAERRYTEAMKAIEELVAAWDFAEALTALGEVEFEEEELAARLTAWREGVGHLVGLKAQIITKINAAKPRLKKSDLMIRGVGGEVVKADETGITAKLPGDKMEPTLWQDLSPQAVDKLVRFGADEQDPDDWLAAGVLALAYHDIPLAEALFGHARSLGADITPYHTPVAAAALGQARQLVEAEEFSKAESLLSNLEAKYTDTAWFVSNRAVIEVVVAEVKAGICEAEAEKVYVEAVEQFEQEQLFDLKPLVEKLKTDYVNSRPVTAANREPSFAAMEKAVADLGLFITVRQDGKADFTSIQAAIDAAPPNSLIEIQDNGPYNEKVAIKKEGLTLRGAKGTWPVVTSTGPLTDFPILLFVDQVRAALEGLVLAHGGAAGSGAGCLVNLSGDLQVRQCVIYSAAAAFENTNSNATLDLCVVAGTRGHAGRALAIKNSVWLPQINWVNGACRIENTVLASSPAGFGPDGRVELYACTILPHLVLPSDGNVVVDCIVHSIESPKDGNRIEHCNAWSDPPFIDRARPGKACFSAPPQFVNPDNLDYRRLPTIARIGKASDGGDIGCRYTPEMIEMCQKALELRAKGIIKF